MKNWPRIPALALALMLGESAMAARMYWCDDSRGKRVQQAPIADCTAKHWYVDGPGPIVWISNPPAAAPEPKPSVPSVDRAAERQDLDLLARYPDEAAHRKARTAQLAVVRERLRAIESRLAELAAERKRLDDEAEFYKGKPLPAALQRRIDDNDARVAAQQLLKSHQLQAAKHIDDKFDVELGRLNKLWAGAPPGSLGLLPVASSPAPRRSKT